MEKNMEIIFKRSLTIEEKEKVRIYVGYYRGIGSFKGNMALRIYPKKNFSKCKLLESLKSLDIPMKSIDVS
ncbi:MULTISPECIES: hypothetical protein [Bacillaceae]|uniref:Uncharacterized protein n=1 Tax=Evansella alkalicola TaxID=745819 RepID=A0ABS6JUH1_9BACI|nr:MULTISPECIES: hypothetical protein [Bacillaceae]MBU9722209.1 hypothetical protein [Bacillus alkalicola]